MNELDALKIASEFSGESIDKMLEIAEKRGFSDEMQNKLRFQSLYQSGYIQGAFQFGLPVTITLAGRDQLEKLQKLAEKDSKDERGKRFDKKLAIAGLFVPLIIFVLEVVIGHFQFFVMLFSKLFG